MKNKKDIALVMDKLNCTREQIESLTDDAFEIVVDLVTKPQKPLTEKERSWALDVAKKFEAGDYLI